MLWLLLIAVVGVVLLYANSRPDTFRVERRATIQAPPERVFAMLNDFREWMAWSPWEKLDPAMQRTYGGAERGVGATYAWSGNKKAGAGQMTITAAEPSTRLGIRLEFTKPFASTNTTEFALTPGAGGTTVSWVMQGPCPFLFRLFGAFLNMDRMIGPDFEAGLANLKAIAER